MKFWAKVKFEGGKNASEVIRAFFIDFHSESSIVIRGNEAMVEVFFDAERPMRLVEAISNCEVIEFNFGKDLVSYEDSTTPGKPEVRGGNTNQVGNLEKNEKSEEEEKPQIKERVEQENQNEEVHFNQPVMKEENLDLDEKSEENFPEKVPAKRQAKRKEKKSSKKVDVPSIPYIEELASKAQSLEQFVSMIATWLELDKRQEFFEKLAMIAMTVQQVSWKELENELKNQGVYYSQWDRIWTVRHISEKLSEYNVTIIPLLEMIVQYKHRFFKENAGENENEKSSSHESGEETEKDSNAKVKSSKMACMPEIPEFEKVLNEIDKTRPIEDRVRAVLTAMGWQMMSPNVQDEIFEFAYAAMRIQEMSFENIFRKAGFLVESVNKERMTFSTFVNEFVQRYAPDKKVKVLDFLKELQPFVMNDSEIDSLEKFNEETL